MCSALRKSHILAWLRSGIAIEQRSHEMLQGQQFGVEEVEVVSAIVDLDEVTSYRGAISSLRDQAASKPGCLFLPLNLTVSLKQG